MALFTRDMRVGERLLIEGGGLRAVITLVEKSGKAARIQVQADEAVRIQYQRPPESIEYAKKGLTPTPAMV